MSKRIRTKKINQTKKVNLEGYYHHKSGKYVGPYDRKAKQYPNHYVTQRIDPKTGQLRWVEITKIPARGGVHASISMKYLDQKPRGVPEVPISFEQARKAFENQPLKSRVIDLQHRAKKVYPADQVTSGYLKSPGRKDVEGVDTPPSKPSLDVRPSLGIRTRYKIDLSNIEGDLSHIPKDIPPSQDKGIYLEKTIHEIDEMIKEYEVSKYNLKNEKEFVRGQEVDHMIYELKVIKMHLLNVPKDKPIGHNDYFEKAQDILKRAQKENDKKFQTKKETKKETKEQLEDKTSDAIKEIKKIISMTHLGQYDPTSLEERLKDSQALLNFLSEKQTERAKEKWDQRIIQIEITNEIQRRLEIEKAKEHQEQREKEQKEAERKMIDAQEKFKKEQETKEENKEPLSKQKTEEAIKKEKTFIAVKHFGKERVRTIEEQLEDSKVLMSFLRDKRKEGTMNEEVLKEEIEKEDDHYRELKRREVITNEIKAKNSELSKEEINQLAYQVELKEKKNKKMLLFLYEKLQSESDGSKIKIETLKNEITKKTKITPEEFDILIKELKKDKEIEQQGTDIVLKKEQKPSKTEVIKPEPKKEQIEKEYPGKLIKITKSGRRYIEFANEPEKFHTTEKAYLVENIWLPKNQMIRENGKIYVAEWLYPQKEKKRLENEIKKIDTYIEEDKNQLKYYQNLLSHPKEDPFSTALPEDRKRNIQHHEESIKKLEVRKENIKQQLSKEEKVKEKPEPKEIKKEEIRLIKFDKDSRVLREEIKSLSEHLPYLEGKEKEKIENAINQRKKEIEDKKETKK